MPGQHRGGRKGCTKLYTLDKLSPPTLSLHKPGSGWEFALEKVSSTSCEMQWGQELPNTALREEQVPAQPCDNAKTMTVVSPHLFTSQHSESNFENHSS